MKPIRRALLAQIAVLIMLLTSLLLSGSYAEKGAVTQTTGSTAASIPLILTDEEAALVEASRVTPVTVGMVISDAPSCYWDAKNGRCAGVFMETINVISEKTGLVLDCAPLDLSLGAPIAQLKAGTRQLVAGIVQTQNFLDDAALVLSEEVLEDSLIVVSPSGTDFTERPQEKTIALMTGFQVAAEYVAERFPEHRLIFYPDERACLDAVAHGLADATVYLRLCMSYLLQDPHYEELEIMPVFTSKAGTCIAGRVEDGSALIKLIDKGLKSLSYEERTGLLMNFTTMNPYELTFAQTMYKYRAPVKIIAALVMIVICTLTAFLISRNLSEKKVQSALILAQQASAEKGNFLSRMSHEIRTPLNAIIGYSTLARSELTEPQPDCEARALDCLTKCDIASRHLLSIINDVLDISAIESGKIKVVAERFHLKGLITSLTTVFYPQAQAKNVNFTVTVDDQTEEWYTGDQMRISQVLTNLLSNAVKFTPSGGRVLLAISQKEMTENSAVVLFEVADTGIGMSKEYLTHIWTPFEQEDSSISRRFGGTGLGLSITKNLVDLMSGSLSVKSAPGEGSTFSVELKLQRTDQPPMTAYQFTKVRALIVDDDPSTCEYINLLFNRFGARSASVFSGEEALKALVSAADAGDPFTLCLVDWCMPDMDGLETIRHIRSLTGTDLPIIVVTAYNLSELQNKTADLGINMLLSKPLFQSTLFDLMASIGGPQTVRKPEIGKKFDFSGMRVLLTEDNAMNMEVARRILTASGLSVDLAWNGQEAVTAFEASPAGTYQAILMDVQMPIMDGYTATRAIRASTHPQAASIPIIAMTADAFAENIAQSRASGMNAHIPKPIDIQALFETLSSCMKD